MDGNIYVFGKYTENVDAYTFCLSEVKTSDKNLTQFVVSCTSIYFG